VTAADRSTVVVAGASFPSLEPETRALAAIGATVVDARRLDAAETAELCRDADGVMTDYFPCSAEVISELARCRIICQYGVGLDLIDVAAATRAGIVVTHTPAYCVDELADHALALILAVARNVVRFDGAVRAGTWDYNCAGPMRRLRGRTLGLLGFGRAGRALASRGQALGLGRRRRLRVRGRPPRRAPRAPGTRGRPQPPRTAHRGDPPQHRACRARRPQAGGNPRQHCARRPR
jgi:D-3-phosphoglycerate dehydrogenase / 2-oxoglutarate reductase